ncbi:hypothetical protein VTJ04DRAFT_3354 [Mycothermus thermophilus]|uniref:uncharacterized protein n=1 Tax=Humicola insolens TaxID=85995 RepID=UPI0037429294
MDIHVHQPSRPTSPPRRPLQNVSETSFQLISPSPLDSILRKSTETGDIGAFSIGILPSINQVPEPVQPAPCKKDDLPCPSPTPAIQEQLDIPDDRRSLPSYRDADLLSLKNYGSIRSNLRFSGFSGPAGDRRSSSFTAFSSASFRGPKRPQTALEGRPVRVFTDGTRFLEARPGSVVEAEDQDHLLDASIWDSKARGFFDPYTSDPVMRAVSLTSIDNFDNRGRPWLPGRSSTATPVGRVFLESCRDAHDEQGVELLPGSSSIRSTRFPDCKKADDPD